MELNDAKEMLNMCVREESRDHAFGDAEIFWTRGASLVAEGYFGGGSASVSFPGRSFEGEEARELRECGTLKGVTRNDETGPAVFVEGYTMPGLTKEAVRKEIFGED